MKQSVHTHAKGNIARNHNDRKGHCMKSVAATFTSRPKKWQKVFWLDRSKDKRGATPYHLSFTMQSALSIHPTPAADC